MAFYTPHGLQVPKWLHILTQEPLIPFFISGLCAFFAVNLALSLLLSILYWGHLASSAAKDT